MKRILLFSYYYSPDLSAGSFRTKALVDELLKIEENIEIDILTTRPIRYSSFKSNDFSSDATKRVSIIRVNTYFQPINLIFQALSFIVYATRAYSLANKKKYNLVFATTSRLMTGFLGALFSKRNNLFFFLDIRDLFNDTVQNVFPKSLILPLNPLLRFFESYTLNQANIINSVSIAFNPYIRERLKDDIDIINFSNGIDSEFLSYDFRNRAVNQETKTILYAGNIGDGQALHKVIPEFMELLPNNYFFKIIGDGSKRKKLEEALRESHQNLEILNPVERNELLKHYKEADILFLHLDDKNAFKKVLPSKVFEYAATQKPILAGVSGFAREFIEQNIVNSFCFDPCNAKGAICVLNDIDEFYTPRDQFLNDFSRANIMNKMAIGLINNLK